MKRKTESNNKMEQYNSNNNNNHHQHQLLFLKSNVPSPNAYSFNSTEYAFPGMVFPLAGITAIAFVANCALVAYILWRRLYRNFVSSQFIVHLCLTNMGGLCVLVPLFLLNLWSGANIWANNNLMCRIQVFFHNNDLFI